MREVVNRLRGQVRVRVDCAFPERILNLCAARNLAFWDLEWESETAFTCRMTRHHWRMLQRAAERLDCSMTVVAREGAPFFLSRFRRRQALVVGLSVCALGMILGSFFVWDFQIEGNETVPAETILRALEKYGVRRGSFGLSLDGEDIRNHVLLEIPELSWITVNVSGCRANVQVRERIPVPELINEREPTNVVARRAGLVLQVQALDGVACVMKGSTVTEGQLLISGVQDTGTFGARMLAGMGRVRARTWYTLTAQTPLTAAEIRPTGEERICISLIFGARRVKFFSNSSIEEGNYDKITTRIPLRVLGFSLPVTVVADELQFYEIVSTERSADRVQEQTKAALEEYLHSIVEPYGEVKSTLCTSRQKGDTLVVTLTAECEEEIGEQIPIYTEEPDEETSVDTGVK